jgi:hypothetical protein
VLQADPSLPDKQPELLAEFAAAPWLLPPRSAAFKYAGVTDLQQLAELQAVPQGRWNKTITLLTFTRAFAVLAQNSGGRLLGCVASAACWAVMPCGCTKAGPALPCPLQAAGITAMPELACSLLTGEACRSAQLHRRHMDPGRPGGVRRPQPALRRRRRLPARAAGAAGGPGHGLRGAPVPCEGQRAACMHV